MRSQDTITLTGSAAGDTPVGEVTIPRELGPVRLLREIGRGGMGVVYLGRHQMLDRDVAVKFLLNAVAGPDDPGFARFLEGARAAARLEHPGLTTIHHADVVDGIPYLVMQYIDGPALSEVLKQTGPLSLSTLFAVLDAVSEAIGELHDRGIIHRDIKPGNVLLSHDGRVVVTDFGLALARPMGQRGPSSERLGGTPAYMAPEMFAGEVSLRSDVYALGVMTFELLTGELPFTGTVEEVREKHLDEPLPLEPLQQRRLDPALIEVLQRATHKNAMFRYKTAEYLRKALRGSIATEKLLREGAAELHRLVPRTLDTEPDATTTQGAETTPTSTYFDRLSEIADEKRATRAPLGEADADKGRQDDRPAAPTPSSDDSPVEPISIPAQPSAEPTAAPTLVADVSCVKCEYNLRGLSADVRCPECGEAVTASLRRDRLLFADPSWVGRIVLGQTLILAATFIFWALLPFVPRNSRGSIAEVMLALSGMAMGGVIVAGVFLCTQRESARSNILHAWATRWAARARALLWLSSWSAGFVLRWSGGVEYPALVALRAAAASGLIVCFFLYLAALARRIPNQRLVKYSNRVTFIVYAFLLLWLAQGS